MAKIIYIQKMKHYSFCNYDYHLGWLCLSNIRSVSKIQKTMTIRLKIVIIYIPVHYVYAALIYTAVRQQATLLLEHHFLLHASVEGLNRNQDYSHCVTCRGVSQQLPVVHEKISWYVSYIGKSNILNFSGKRSPKTPLKNKQPIINHFI